MSQFQLVHRPAVCVTDCTIHTLVMQVGLHNALEAGIFRTRGDVTFGLGNAIHVGYG